MGFKDWMKKYYIDCIFVFLVLMVLIGLKISIFAAWLFILILFGLSFAALGIGLDEHGDWRGLIIDRGRDRISLSRFQMTLWTMIVLSGVFTIAFVNIRGGEYLGALDINIPELLWVLMGISATSLVGSQLIIDNDSGKFPATKTPPRQPAWKDLFKDEKKGKEDDIALSRVQMFYFTVLIATDPGIGLPGLSDGLVALLGISHAGYLTAKTTPSPTTPPKTPDSTHEMY